jgi:hypothetical protein
MKRVIAAPRSAYDDDDDDEEGEEEEEEEDGVSALYISDKDFYRRNRLKAKRTVVEKTRKESDKDQDYVYDDISLDIKSPKHYNNGLINDVYSRELGRNATTTSVWRRKILEIISKQKSNVYQFGLALANLLHKPTEYIISEFPRDYINPIEDGTNNIKTLLKNLIDDLPNTKDEKEWFIKQVIIRSILQSLDEYRKDLIKNETKKIPPKTTEGAAAAAAAATTTTPRATRRADTEGGKNTTDEGTEEGDIQTVQGNASKGNMNFGSKISATRTPFKIGANTNIGTLNQYKTQLENITGGSTETTNLLNILVTKFGEFLNDFSKYIDHFDKIKNFISIKYEDYVSLTSLLQDILTIINEAIDNKYGFPEYEKITELYSAYIYLSTAYEEDNYIPLSFLKKMYEFGKRVLDIAYKKIAINDEMPLEKKNEEIEKEVIYLTTRYSDKSLENLKKKFDFIKVTKSFQFQEKEGLMSDVASLLKYLNDLDYSSGELNANFIEPWKKSEENSIAMIFFTENIYGFLQVALRKINILAKKDFLLMELITSEDTFTIFAEYVAHVHSSSDVNMRRKDTGKEYSLAWSNTRYQIINDNLTVKGMVEFFSHVKRATIIDTKGKFVREKLVHVSNMYGKMSRSDANMLVKRIFDYPN